MPRARVIEQRAQLVLGRHPAGRVVRRVDDDEPGRGVARRDHALEPEPPPPSGWTSRSTVRTSAPDEPCRRDHRVDILDPAVERQIVNVPVGQPAAALIMAHEAETLPAEADPVAPCGTLELVVEVRQPVRCLDENRPRAHLGPGQLNAVAGAQISNALASLLLHGTTGRLQPLHCGRAAGEDDRVGGARLLEWPVGRDAQAGRGAELRRAAVPASSMPGTIPHPPGPRAPGPGRARTRQRSLMPEAA